jgi:hypothetical protein
MAKYRGIVQGNRGAASRLGNNSSGITVEAQSWNGKVVVRMWSHTEHCNTMAFTVNLEPHEGSGPSTPLASGTVTDSGGTCLQFGGA